MTIFQPKIRHSRKTTLYNKNIDSNLCEDIDECMISNAADATASEKASSGCDASSETCINKIGSFTCECAIGFVKNEESGKCEDVDECQNPDLQKSCKGGKNFMCVNNPGSFACACKPQYHLSEDESSCQPDHNCVGVTCEIQDQICVKGECACPRGKALIRAACFRKQDCWS